MDRSKQSGSTARLIAVRLTILGLASLIAAPLAVTTVGAATPSGLTLASNGRSATVLSQRTIAGGDIAESWRVGDVTVTAAAPPGSIVSVLSSSNSGGGGQALASVRLPAIDKSGPSSGLRAVQRYLASGRSIQAEALAVGFSAAEASQLTGQFSSGSQTQLFAQLFTSVGQYFNSACVNVSGNSNQAHGHACIGQKLMQANGADWYVGDEITSTGWDSDYWWGLSGLQAWDQYGANNTIFNYNPSSRQYPSSCSNVTYNLSYNGVGVSATNTLCPSHLDPKFWGNTGYGTNWTGCASVNETVGAPGVDLDHNPWNASQYATINVSIWWNCFL